MMSWTATIEGRFDVKGAAAEASPSLSIGIVPSLPSSVTPSDCGRVQGLNPVFAIVLGRSRIRWSVKAIRVVVSNQDHKDFRGNPIATDSSFRGEKRREAKRARNSRAS
jgi:hypothetical protein